MPSNYFYIQNIKRDRNKEAKIDPRQLSTLDRLLDLHWSNIMAEGGCAARSAPVTDEEIDANLRVTEEIAEKTGKRHWGDSLSAVTRRYGAIQEVAIPPDFIGHGEEFIKIQQELIGYTIIHKESRPPRELHDRMVLLTMRLNALAHTSYNTHKSVRDEKTKKLVTIPVTEEDISIARTYNAAVASNLYKKVQAVYYYEDEPNRRKKQWIDEENARRDDERVSRCQALEEEIGKTTGDDKLKLRSTSRAVGKDKRGLIPQEPNRSYHSRNPICRKIVDPSDSDDEFVERRYEKKTKKVIEKPIGEDIQGFFSNTRPTVFTSVEKITDILKPLTFMRLINDIIKSKGHIERIAIVTSTLEAYGLYWKSATVSIQQISSLVLVGVEFISSIIANKQSEREEDSEETEAKLRFESSSDNDSGDLLKKFFRSIGEKMPDGAEKAGPIVKLVAPLLYMGFSGLSLTSPGKKVVKVTDHIARSCKNNSTIYNSLEGIHKGVSEAIRMTFEPESYTIKETFSAQIRTLIGKMHEFQDSMVKDRMKILDTKIWDEIDTDYNAMCNIYDSFSKMKENFGAMTTLYITATKQYEEVRKTYMSLKAIVSFRQEPTCLWLYGEPGVGKSQFAKFIANELSRIEGKDLTIYNRNPKDEYFSGYVGQDIVIYDDFGSSVKGVDIDEFVSMKSSNPYPLNMAGIDDKGYPFTSRYIIICSNLSGILTTDVITNPWCMDRRRDYFIFVEDDIAIECRLNGEELPEDHYQDDYSHLSLTRMNPNLGRGQQAYSLWQGCNPRYSTRKIATEMVKTQEHYKGKFLRETELAREREQRKAGIVEEDEEDFSDLDDAERTVLQHHVQSHKCSKPGHVGRVRPAPQPKQKKRRVNAETEERMERVFRPITGRGNQDVRLDFMQHLQNEEFEFESLAQSAQLKFQAGHTTYYKSFVLIGEQNMGKSKLMATLRDKGCRYRFYDEFTAGSPEFKPEEAVSDVWDSYDRGDSPCVLACNTSTYNKDFFKRINRDKTAFERRVVKFVFSIKLMKIATVKFRKTINYDTDMEYTRIETLSGSSKSTKVTFIEMLMEILKEQRPIVTETNVVTELPKWEKPLPENALRFREAAGDFESLTVKDLVRKYFRNEFEDLTKLKGQKKMDLVKILIRFKDIVGKPIPLAFIELNAMKLTTKREIEVMIAFADHYYVLSTEGEFVVVYDVDDSRRDEADKTLCNLMVELKSDKKKNQHAKQVCLELLDGMVYFLKLVVGGGAYIHGFVEMAKAIKKHDSLEKEGDFQCELDVVKTPPREKAKFDSDMLARLVEKTVQEALGNTWGSMMDLADGGAVDPNEGYDIPSPRKKVAKSTRSKEVKGQQYCSDCHSTTCVHCINYEIESNEEKLLKIKQKKKPLEETNYRVLEALEDERKSGAAKRAGKATKTYRPSNECVQSVLPARQPSIDVMSGNFLTLPTNSSARMSAMPYSIDELQKESMKDPQAREVARACIGNTVYVGTRDRLIMRALMVGANIGVTTCHGLADKKKGEFFNAFLNSTDYSAQIILMDARRDLVIFRLKDSPMFKNICKHIATRKDTTSRQGSPGWLCVTTSNTQSVFNVVIEDTSEKTIEGEKRYGLNYRGHLAGQTYGPVNTKQGDCGSPLILLDSTKPRKILSLHMAGSGVTGIGALIFGDELQQIIDKYGSGTEEIEKESWYEDESEEQVGGRPLRLQCLNRPIKILKHQKIKPIEPFYVGYYEVLGITWDPEKQEPIHMFQNNKTRYWDSPLAITEGVFEPVVLCSADPRPKEKFRPYETGMNKYNREQASMDEFTLCKAVDGVADFLATLIHQRNIYVRVLTKTESINGVSWLETSNPIQRDTSAGYPWKFLDGFDVKKEDFLHFDHDKGIWFLKCDKRGKVLNESIDQLIDCARKGIVTASVNCGTMKDEPRKIKRIYDDPNTRIFWAAPLDKVLADRMYFGAAIAAISDTHELHPIKIGINPIGIGYHQLYHWHARVSTLGFDVDAKNFDSSVPYTVMSKVPRVWNKIYQLNDPTWKEQDDIVRETLHAYAERPLVLYRDFVVRFPGGNPSGQSLTGTDNSIIHFIYDYYIWLRLCQRFQRTEWMNMQSFLRHVASSFYGDDGMTTVSAEARSLFTPNNYIIEAGKFGVVCTPADKKEGKPKMKPLCELEFLKRNFAKAELPNGEESKYWCGRLQEESFSKMLDLVQCTKPHDYWRDRGVVRFNICTIVGTIDMALIEAANYGRDYWGRLRKHLLTRCRDYNIQHSHWLSFEDCYSMIWRVDLSGDFQPIYGSGETYRFESMSMPVIPGGPNAELAHDNSGGGAPHIMEGRGASIPKMSKMVQEATGSPGMLPAELYKRSIWMGTYTWSTSMAALTPIFTADIAPSGANAYVQYFCRIYNAWAGGLIWEWEVAGTGFNGGKLIAIILPPNKTIASLRTTQDWSIYPNRTFDVKAAATENVEGVDERNRMFHWMDRSVEVDTVAQKGGTFVLAVAAALKHASGATATVDIMLWNRPAPDFRVSQMIHLTPENAVIQDLSGFTNLFPKSFHAVLSPYDDYEINKFVILSNTGTPFTNVGTYGQVQGDGSDFARPYTPWRGMPLLVKIDTVDYRRRDTGATVNRPLSIDVIRPQVTTTSIFYSGWSRSGQDIYGHLNDFGPVYFYESQDNVTLLDARTSIANMQADSVQFDYHWCYYHQASCKMLPIVDPDFDTAVLPLNGESLIKFAGDRWRSSSVVGASGDANEPMESTTTTAIIAGMKDGRARLSPGQCMLYRVVDKITGLPYMYMKQYYEGFFTTKGTSTTIVGNYWDNDYIPQEFMLESSPIPGNLEMQQNEIMVMSNRSRMLPKKDIFRELLSRFHDMNVRFVEEEDAVGRKTYRIED